MGTWLEYKYDRRTNKLPTTLAAHGYNLWREDKRREEKGRDKEEKKKRAEDSFKFTFSTFLLSDIWNRNL